MPCSKLFHFINHILLLHRGYHQGRNGFPLIITKCSLDIKKDRTKTLSLASAVLCTVTTFPVLPIQCCSKYHTLMETSIKAEMAVGFSYFIYLFIWQIQLNVREEARVTKIAVEVQILNKLACSHLRMLIEILINDKYVIFGP